MAVDRTDAEAARLQVQKEGTCVLRAQVFWLATRVCAAVADSPQVVLLGDGLDTAQRHIFDHAQAEWVDRVLNVVGHGSIPHGPSRPIQERPGGNRTTSST